MEELPPIPVAKDGSVEIHLLSGHKQLCIGIWSLWSFLRHNGAFPVILHSDGSIAAEDVELLNRIVPNVTVVHAPEAASALEKTIGGPEFEHLRRFRASHKLAPKLIDTHLFGDSPTILLLDTDVLFFGRADEVLERCAATPSDGLVTSMTDVFTAYVDERPILNERLGLELPDKLNSGLMVMPRLGSEDFRLAEKCVRSFEPQWLRNPFTEQTLYAVMAARRGWHGLGAPYQIVPGKPDSIAIHYVSGGRAQFYTDGIPRLSRALQSTPRAAEPKKVKA